MWNSVDEWHRSARHSRGSWSHRCAGTEGRYGCNWAAGSCWTAGSGGHSRRCRFAGAERGPGLGRNTIVEKAIDGCTVSAYLAWIPQTEKFLFGSGDICGLDRIVTQRTFPAGTFYHVTAIHDGAALRLYVNGQLEAERTVTRSVQYNSSEWTIGNTPSAYRGGYPRTWNGVIDEVRIEAIIPGQPGPAGPQGTAGPQGLQGLQGPSGPQGQIGTTGPEGPSLPSGTLLPFAGQNAPVGYLICDGRQVSRSLYAALYAVIGDLHGAGDLVTTFNLPDMRGRVPMGAGQGAGLSSRPLASKWGQESYAISVAEMPAHQHETTLNADARVQFGVAGGGPGINGSSYATFSHALTSFVGGGAPHPTLQPSLSVTYIIKY